MLNPQYKLPSRKTVSTSLLPQLYAKTKEQVFNKLKNAQAVCLTTDCWTSINNQSFMAVTSHFIDAVFKLDSVLLESIEFDQRHTANNLATRLQEITRKWGLENKIAACISDNANNIVAAIRQCQWRHLSCFSHSLNLVVQRAIKEDAIAPIISNIKSIVEHFKRSPHALAKLHTTQEQMGLAQLKLKQDVATRWNSTLEMLSMCFETKDTIVATIALLDTNLPTINQTE
ncbi:zinc finger BED domain-containing protein 1-like [Anoplophora glabripennis]|uniref:zinc finger BED domain-containing protein 1-like n=1 Tax=Anoplophora glabripennis TaxID=217634 RepID=UPI000875876E|nr:zinc finger BED domain-containing protein 1-like [Anoplophora glabripennis]